jgi:hypothetical protein
MQRMNKIKSDLASRLNNKLNQSIADGTYRGWLYHAIEETKRILTQDLSLSGWDGVGWSLAPPNPQWGNRFESIAAMRGGDSEHWIVERLKRLESYTPVIRYYASYGESSPVTKEVYRQRDGGVIVAAGLALRGFADGRPAFIVEQIQRSELTMLMVRDISQQMCDMGNAILRKIMEVEREQN